MTARPLSASSFIQFDFSYLPYGPHTEAMGLGKPMADLLEAMRRNPQGNWNINDAEKVCAQNGVTCTPPRGGGSHYKVSHKGMTYILTIPSKRPIKPVYIRALVAFIDIVRTLP
jgi:hypothetical protein